MSPLAAKVQQLLGSVNGGPGATAVEIAARLGMPLPFVRQELAALVFREQVATCDREGRYRLGDPTPLLTLD